MPFKSEAQRRLLWATRPDIAKRWAHEYGTPENLPERKSESPVEGAANSVKRFLSGRFGNEQERKRLKPPQGMTGTRG